MGRRSYFTSFCLALAAASVLHAPTLLAWAPFAWSSLLFSATLLAPVVCLYLLHIDPRHTDAAGEPAWLPAVALFAVAALLVAGAGGPLLRPPGGDAIQTWLAWRMASWVMTVLGFAFLFGGLPLAKRYPFPLLYLLTAIPLPTAAEMALEELLQHGSAFTLKGMLLVTGPTFHQPEPLVFQVPGITIQVAPECSGINSSVVLFTLSLVAGYLFLRSPAKRALLSLFVLPLALLRNGFRIWTLIQLCVYDNPSWIDSDLHHRGGPIFFTLSLIPFSLLLWWLYKREQREKQRSEATQSP